MDAASVYALRKLLERIDETEQAWLHRMRMGQFDDFPAYKDAAGFLRGLQQIREWIEQIDFEDEKRHGP